MTTDPDEDPIASRLARLDAIEARQRQLTRSLIIAASTLIVLIAIGLIWLVWSTA